MLRVEKHRYSGGEVTFLIPEHWVQEVDPDGTISFYENAPNSGTLRLNLLTAQRPPSETPSDGYAHLLEMGSSDDHHIRRLASGDGMRVSSRISEEAGHSIMTYFWEVCHCVPPNTMRVAIFSWTILSAFGQDPKYRREIAELENWISGVRFDP